jgi:NAD(P)H-dependent flavin oxidoreductase YrpB (nitropropane dioxygenase family)
MGEMPKSSSTLGWNVPIVQATLGACDTPALAAAVSNAGGLGTLCLHAPTVAETRQRLKELDRLTKKPVLLAFTGQWEREEVLDACLELGHRHFHVFWWNAARLTRRIQAAGALAYQQIGTLPQLEEALGRGVNGLVLQGTRAGGPVRSPMQLCDLVPTARARFSGPILAGGGLATRTDAHDVLTLGADAAFFGTRFLLSPEAAAPQEHKERLARASASDLFLDTRLIGDWPCAPRRRLPLPTNGHGTTSLEAGLGLDAITDIRPAAELVKMLNPR